MTDDTQYQITPEFVTEWNRIRDKVDRLSGDGVHNSSTAITIGGQDDGSDPHHHFQFTYVRIDGPTDDNGDGRYLGTPYIGGTNSAPTDLGEDDIGYIDDNANQVEIWNLAEIGDSAPLDDGAVVACWVGGFNTDTQTPIFHCDKFSIGTPQYVGEMFLGATAQNKPGWVLPSASPSLT